MADVVTPDQFEVEQITGIQVNPPLNKKFISNPPPNICVSENHMRAPAKLDRGAEEDWVTDDLTHLEILQPFRSCF